MRAAFIWALCCGEIWNFHVATEMKFIAKFRFSQQHRRKTRNQRAEKKRYELRRILAVNFNHRRALLLLRLRCLRGVRGIFATAGICRVIEICASTGIFRAF